MSNGQQNSSPLGFSFAEYRADQKPLSTIDIATGELTKASTFNRTAKAVPMLFYTDASQFTLGGAGATKADNYGAPDPVLSPSAIKVVHPAATNITATLDRILPAPVDIGSQDMFEIWFHVKQGTLLNGVDVRFSTSAQAGNFTNCLRANLLVSPFFGGRDTGWNVLRWRKSDMEVVGTIDKTAASIPINQVRIGSGNAAGGLEITYDSIWMNPKTRAKACVMFDDGFAEQYDFGNREGVFTYMSDRGMKGTIGVISGLVNSGSYMNHEQLRIIDAAGWDLAVHGIAGFAGSLQNLLLQIAEDEAVANVKLNRQFLINQGYTRAANYYVFPQGQYSESLLTKIRALGIRAARATYETLAYTYFAPTDYMMKLPCVGIGARTFAQIKPFIDHAINTGGQVILGGHRLTTDPVGTGLFTNVSEFKQMIDYLKSQSAVIDTVPFSELVSLSGLPRIN